MMTNKTIIKQANKNKLAYEQEHILNELNENKNKFQSLIEITNDWAWIVDEDSKYIYVNPIIENILGYKPEEVIWKTPFDLMPRREAEKILQISSEIVQKREPFEWLENINIHKNWHIVILETRWFPIYDENWIFKWYKWASKNISKRKKAEDELRKYQNNLENIIKERTKALEISNKKLLKLSKIKDEFVSITSHELRTPMTVIRTYTALLLEQTFWSLNWQQIDFLNRILNNSTQLISLVNDMLDIWKLEAWKMDFQIWKYDILDNLHNIIRDYSTIFNEKDIKLIYKNPAFNKAIAYFDPEMLDRIMINLLSNALKFTNPWWKVEVWIRYKKRNPSEYEVYVKDSWIWIPKDKQKTIFQKFSQVESTLSRNQWWTWLWLAIINEIIKKMWWKIKLKSEIWKWSTFYFTIIENMYM